MEKHITVLGAMFLGLGVLGVIGMATVVAIFGLGCGVLANLSEQEPDLPGLVVLLPLFFGTFITVIIAITSIPCFVVSYGLIKRRHWAKVAALAVGVLNILVVPLGTIVGIYALWFFLQEGTDQLFGPRPEY